MDNQIIEDAKLIFKNFSGAEGKFNRAGDRNFHILLDEKKAKQMEKEGWNIKYLTPREEGDVPQPHIKVKVAFGNRPPKIVIISSRGKSQIDESEVGMLDWAELEKVDISITPYEWDYNGQKGVTAYLKSLYATIETDPLEDKYYEAEDSAQNCIGGCGDCFVCDHDGPCKEEKDD